MRNIKTGDISQAVKALGEGKLVAFPTDTVWGLAADAANDEAVAELFIAKGRPILQPLAILLPNREMAGKLAIFNDPASALASEFWPGALTLVLPQRPGVPVSPLVSAGLPSVGLRVPAHPLAQDLLNAFGRPLAVTSANPSGEASAVTAGEVAEGLGDAVALILEGEPTPAGVESTVVSTEEDKVNILRAGAVAAKTLAEVVEVPVTGESA